MTGHMLNWGKGQQLYPFPMTMAGASFGGVMPAMGGSSSTCMMMPAEAMQIQSGGSMQGGGQGSGTFKRKHLCNNCGAMDHGNISQCARISTCTWNSRPPNIWPPDRSRVSRPECDSHQTSGGRKGASRESAR
jgi:hypothetical protein